MQHAEKGRERLRYVMRVSTGAQTVGCMVGQFPTWDGAQRERSMALIAGSRTVRSAVKVCSAT
jgi:hypothetical protein